MNKSDFFYALPPELIAQCPSPERSASRMMVMNRRTGHVTHRHFYEITSFLQPGDCLVINDSRVIPARLYGYRARPDKQPGDKQAVIEMLLHERLDDNHWEVLIKPGRKAKPGDTLMFGDNLLMARVERITDDGLRLVALEYDGSFETLLEKIGEMPLPHYIKTPPGGAADRERYQTVYAAHNGSVAAPTAGLHFTGDILNRIQNNGVKVARVTLHVGIGTFRPVKTDNITEHHMHSEFCRIEPEQADIINDAKSNGGRIIAVGTTACRTLESRSASDGTVIPGSGKTDIFIYPGYQFRILDGLLTNFHLPESTLLMLVSAFAGREHTLDAYRLAIEEQYRFYSYGDCMFIY